MTKAEGLLKMADIISVDDNIVYSTHTEDGITTFFDIDEQLLGQFPGDEDKILVNIAVQGEDIGVYYSYDLNEKFIGISLFEEDYYEDESE